MPTSFEQETARKQREYERRVAARSASRGNAPPAIAPERVNHCRLMIARVLLSAADADKRIAAEVAAADAADPARASLPLETKEARAIYTVLRSLAFDPDEC